MRFDFSSPRGRRTAGRHFVKHMRRAGLPGFVGLLFFIFALIPLLLNIVLWLVFKVVLILVLYVGYRWCSKFIFSGDSRDPWRASHGRHTMQTPQRIQTNPRILSSFDTAIVKLTNSENNETRRMHLDAAALTREGLEYQVYTLFPEISGHYVLLQYTDEDGDKITIRNEAEFDQACLHILELHGHQVPLRFSFSKGAEREADAFDGVHLNASESWREFVAFVRQKLETYDVPAKIAELTARVNRFVASLAEDNGRGRRDRRSSGSSTTSEQNFSSAQPSTASTGFASSPPPSAPEAAAPANPPPASAAAFVRPPATVNFPTNRSTAFVEPVPTPSLRGSSSQRPSQGSSSGASTDYGRNSADQDWESIINEIHAEEWEEEVQIIKQVLPAVDEQRCKLLLRQHDGDMTMVVDQLMSEE